MGFFGRGRRGLLPPDSASHLATYARFEVDPQNAAMPDTAFLAALQSPELKANGGDAVNELWEIARREGGWALCGASYAIAAFFPVEADSTPAQLLRDDRIRFLEAEFGPGVVNILGVSDMGRYEELFRQS